MASTQVNNKVALVLKSDQKDGQDGDRLLILYSEVKWSDKTEILHKYSDEKQRHKVRSSLNVSSVRSL